jgi:hypothetical protein
MRFPLKGSAGVCPTNAAWYFFDWRSPALSSPPVAVARATPATALIVVGAAHPLDKSAACRKWILTMHEPGATGYVSRRLLRQDCAGVFRACKHPAQSLGRRDAAWSLSYQRHFHQLRSVTAQNRTLKSCNNTSSWPRNTSLSVSDILSVSAR